MKEYASVSERCPCGPMCPTGACQCGCSANNNSLLTMAVLVILSIAFGVFISKIWKRVAGLFPRTG